MKWRYKTLMLLTLLIFCVGSVSAVEPDNSTTINNVSVINGSSDLTDNTDLNFNMVVLPFSHNSNSLNNNIIKTNSSEIIKVNNSHYNVIEKLKNSNCSDLMNKSMYNKRDIKPLINVLNSSDDNFLINNITIKDIMNNLFKDDGVINLTSTINYIDYILDYDIVQMRITLKTVKEYLINLNVNKVNASTVDNDLKPFMVGLRNKIAKLTVFGAFINVLNDYFKTNIKPNQKINDVTNDKPIKHVVDVNNLKPHVKQLTHMIAYLNFMEKFLNSIKSDLKLINNENTESLIKK